jgi:hypothetical protein
MSVCRGKVTKLFLLDNIPYLNSFAVMGYNFQVYSNLDSS